MSCINYITDLLNLKDKNDFFKENCYFEEKTKEMLVKIINTQF